MRAAEGIELRGVAKTFGSTVALRGVDVCLPSAGLVLLEGANGSGKSTLLGVLGTMVRPSAGSVWHGRFGRTSEEVRGALGWVSHEALAYRDLSGRKNVELAAQLKGLHPEASWQEAKQRFGLGSFAERPLRTCSRGQRQRLALARALVGDPDLLLLDEPTTGLDKAGVGVLLSALDGALRRGALAVVVTHEPTVFEGRARTRVRLEAGRVGGVDCFT